MMEVGFFSIFKRKLNCCLIVYEGSILLEESTTKPQPVELFPIFTQTLTPHELVCNLLSVFKSVLIEIFLVRNKGYKS